MSGGACGAGRGLILRPGALGDVLLALPAAELVSGSLPLSSMDWIGYPACLEWLQGTPLADRIFSIDRPLFCHLFDDRQDDALDTFLASFSFCVAWARDGEGHLRRRLERIFQERAWWTPSFPEPGSGVHAADHLWRGLRDWPYLRVHLPADLPDDAPPARHPLCRQGTRSASRGILHPGSGGARKCWPLERFQEAALALAEAGWEVAWVLGPAEEKIEPRIADFAGRHSMPLLSQCRLREMAGQLLRARWYLGNDSGMTHLAAFCGAETFAVFGPTDPRVWGPRGDRVHIMYNEPDPLEWPESRRVVQTIQSVIEKK